jgi:3-hydroxybutyryl-CoA dehydrogenase
MGVIGVVGAGVMGIGVAQALAEHEHDVVLVDVDAANLERARRQLTQNVRLRRLVGGAEAPRDANEILAAVHFTADHSQLRKTEYVIENAPEKWGVKVDVYRTIDDLCTAECIFAANTSAIPITRIASVTRRPDKVIGIHFMNPVPVKHTVELIAGHHTSEETVRRTVDLLTSMGKEAIRVKDSPGFVSNRVLMLTINEAAFLVHEGVAEPGDVDRVFVSCFGHAMGPLATADLIGLDTILYSIEVLYDAFSDSKYRPCPLLRSMVDAGLLGRKTGRGFFTYA